MFFRRASWWHFRSGNQADRGPGRRARSRRLLQIEQLESRLVPEARILGGLEFVADGFTTKLTDNGTEISATTVVEVGLASTSFKPLLTLDGGIKYVDNNASGTFTTFGDVTAVLGSKKTKLLDGSHTFQVPALLGGGASASGGKTQTVAGVQFTFATIQLTDDAVKLQGSITIPKLSGLTIDVKDTNYVVINGSGVSLTGVAATLPSTSFTAAGLTFDAKNLTVAYAAPGGSNGNHDVFSFTGTTSFQLRGETVTVEFGDNHLHTKGLVIQDGSLVGLDMAVGGNFKVAGVSFTNDSLRIDYASSGGAETYALTGGAHFTLKGNSIQVGFGTGGGTHGLVIRDGDLASLDMTVSANFQLLGMDVGVQSLTISYLPNPERFIMYGGLSVSAGGAYKTLDQLTAKLGTAQAPGLEIIDGKLSKLNVTLLGTFSLFGLVVAPKDFHVQYDKNTDEVQLGGGVNVQVTSQIKGEATLPDGGITIDATTGAVEIHGLHFKFDVTIGMFEVHGLEITYAKNNGITNFSASAQGGNPQNPNGLKFPGGFTIGGSFAFTNGKLVEIGLSYDSGSSQGIAVPNTGLFVTHLDGRIENLDHPNNLIVTAGIRIAYGKTIVVNQTTYSLFTAQARIKVTSDELDLIGLDQDPTQDVNSLPVAQGAGFQLMSKNNHGLVGDGEAIVALNWRTGTYSARLHVGLFDHAIDFDGSFTFNSTGDITITGSAAAKAPADIPVIGGESLGSANFYLQVRPNSADPATNSYAAAWVSIPYLGDRGFKIDFNHKVSNLNDDGVSNLGKDTQNTPQAHTYSATFVVPAHVTLATFTLASREFADLDSNSVIGVTYPKTNPLVPKTVVFAVDGPGQAHNTLVGGSPPQFTLPADVAVYDERWPVLIPAFDRIVSERVINIGPDPGQTTLRPGTYVVFLRTPAAQPLADPNSLKITAGFKYSPPTIAVTNVSSHDNSSTAVIHLTAKSFNLNKHLGANTLVPSGSPAPGLIPLPMPPEISLYYTTSSEPSDHSGTLIRDHIPASAVTVNSHLDHFTFAGDVAWNDFADLASQPYAETRLYVYAAINDGQNPTAYSATFGPVIPPDPRPEIVAPPAALVNGSAAVVFSTANGNAITVKDRFALGNGPSGRSGATDAPVAVTISVLHGMLKIAGGTGQQKSIVLTGKPNKTTGALDAVNHQLDGLRYVPDADFQGNDALTISAQTTIRGRDYSSTSAVDLFQPTLDIALTQAVDQATPQPGDTIHLSITAANKAQDDIHRTGQLDATNVVVTHTLAPELAVEAFTASAGRYDPDSGTWSISSIAAGTSVSLDLTLTVGPDTIGQLLTSTARGTADQFDRASDNNASTVVVHPRFAQELQFSQANFSALEGGGVAHITVTRTGSTSGRVSVRFASTDGTAAAGADYATTEGMLTFDDGVITRSFELALTDDNVDELDETINLTLSDPSGAPGQVGLGGQSTAVLHLIDDDTAELTIDNVKQFEGDTLGKAAQPFVFTVHLSNPSDRNVAVTCVTSDGKAKSVDHDYVAATGILTFAPGETSKPFPVLVNGDTKVEPDEFFVVAIATADNAAGIGNSATGVIVNDDGPHHLSINSVSAAEANSLAFTVRLDTPTARTVTVDYETINGTASAPSDFVPASGTLTFLPGETAKTLVVQVNQDAIFEPNETCWVKLSHPTNASIATLGPNVQDKGQGTILNDDPLPVVLITPLNSVVLEGDSGTRDVLFTVRLSNPSYRTVSVTFTTVDDTATHSNGDYIPSGGSLVFAPGSNVPKTVIIQVSGDQLFEPDESFFVNWHTSPDQALVVPRSVITIKNDEPSPTLTITPSLTSIQEGNFGPKIMVFTVSLNVASFQTVTVKYQTQDGTATARDRDYTPVSGLLTFEPGQLQKTIAVAVLSDRRHESDEDFLVSLLDAKNALIFKPGQATARILDDD